MCVESGLHRNRAKVSGPASELIYKDHNILHVINWSKEGSGANKVNVCKIA